MRPRIVLALLLSLSLVGLWGTAPAAASAPEQQAGPTYSIWNIEYAFLPVFPVSALVYQQHNQGNTTGPFNITLIKGNGRVIVFDSGFKSETWIKAFGAQPHEVPATTLGRFGLKASDVTDVVLSHIHFDHAEAVPDWPNATVWVQRDELDGWNWATTISDEGARKWVNQYQDPSQLLYMQQLAAQGRLRVVNGESQILPGIRVYPILDTHTFGSQFATVQTDSGPIVLAGDGVYVYKNITDMLPIGWGTGSQLNMLLGMVKMKGLVNGNTDRVIPGHDNGVYEKYPSWKQQNGLRTAELALSGGHPSMIPK